MAYEGLCRKCFAPTGIACLLLDDLMDNVTELYYGYEWHDRLTSGKARGLWGWDFGAVFVTLRQAPSAILRKAACQAWRVPKQKVRQLKAPQAPGEGLVPNLEREKPGEILSFIIPVVSILAVEYVILLSYRVELQRRRAVLRSDESEPDGFRNNNWHRNYGQNVQTADFAGFKISKTIGFLQEEDN
ncbi:hypothetical protein M422DRAFT_268723 [Sphaerobolus stellatus SS14]|uniref:Uncharacterized protein n=1 Tax=Sphaerobolus stellatus (strain SS14) TaxID=990650 RepID=A0A0C9ULQ2_SPHS4|nr:hypothetical protein M422DRAFT_268723 [Sphaerobolus stellatus SS14]